MKQYFKAINKIIKNPIHIMVLLGNRNLLNWIPDEKYLSIRYKAGTGKKLNLRYPTTFNEKLQWLKLNNRKDYYTTLVDKYEVRKYISEKIGEEYLVPIIGIYNDVNEICWEELPKKFVLKCTHASATNIICTNKNELNIKEANRKLRKWMKINYYWSGREWPYKNVKPRIICEKFLEELAGVPNDYKIMCFNGKAKIIQIHRNRMSERHTEDFYDLYGNRILCGKSNCPTSNIDKIDVSKFDEIIQLAEKLAYGQPYVRIDFYLIKDKIYFGEITFFDSSGFADFTPDEYNIKFGDMICLEHCK